jgi:hypothetical protein
MRFFVGWGSVTFGDGVTLWCKMNDKLKRICKKVVTVCLRYYPDIFLEGLKKTAINLSQDSQCPSWDLNRVPHEYKSGAVLLCLPIQSDSMLCCRSPCVVVCFILYNFNTEGRIKIQLHMCYHLECEFLLSLLPCKQRPKYLEL